MKKEWQKLNRSIRAACADKAIADDDRKAIIKRISGQDSSTKCTVAQMHLVLMEINSGGSNNTFVKTDKKYVRKIFALWNELKMRGALNDSSFDALLAFVNNNCSRSFTNVRQLAWLTYDQATPVLEALKGWVKRTPLKEVQNV
jgi:hypothetical protein